MYASFVMLDQLGGNLPAQKENTPCAVCLKLPHKDCRQLLSSFAASQSLHYAKFTCQAITVQTDLG